MSKVDLIKKYLINGKTVDEILQEKHGMFDNGWKVNENEVVFYFSPSVVLDKNPLTSEAEYRWSVRNGNIIPLNGRASELMPELDEANIKMYEIKDSVPTELLRIHSFFNIKHGEEGWSESETIELASKQFGLSEAEIEEIVDKVEKMISEKILK